MSTSKGMRGVLERLRERDIATPFLELRERWELANGPAPDAFREQTLIDHGLQERPLPGSTVHDGHGNAYQVLHGGHTSVWRADARWISYFTSASGKEALLLLHARERGEAS